MHLDNMEQIQKRVLEDMDLSEENDDARIKGKNRGKGVGAWKMPFDFLRRRAEICSGNFFVPLESWMF